MNILLFSTHSRASEKAFFGGAESSIELIARHLHLNGHGVIWLCNTKGSFFWPRTEKSHFDGVPIRLFKPMKGAERLSLVSKINRRGFKKYLEKVLIKEKIDVVYCSYDLPFLDKLLKLREMGVKYKIVMRMAGMHWYEQCLREPLLIRKYEEVFNKIDGVNFIHHDLEKMVKEKLADLKMNVCFKQELNGDIGSSVAVGREKAYRKLKNTMFTLMMVARFSRYQKRQDLLVKAVKLVSADIPLKLVLVGNGFRRREIEAMISALGVAQLVSIEEFMEQQALWDKLKSADMLCHACDYEGLGKTIIESMAVGLPVLASNVRPLNKYIREGENGFLVDNNVAAWAERITSLYHEKEKRFEVSENAMKFIRKEYDPRERIRSYERFFESVVRTHNTLGGGGPMSCPGEGNGYSLVGSEW
jgi:L-malate glycosyltransferase